MEAAIKADPRLPTPLLPPGDDKAAAAALAGHSFSPAVKRISSAEALQRFLGSQVAKASGQIRPVLSFVQCAFLQLLGPVLPALFTAGDR